MRYSQAGLPYHDGRNAIVPRCGQPDAQHRPAGPARNAKRRRPRGCRRLPDGRTELGAPARDVLDVERDYSTKISMYSKFELVESATSVMQMRFWPVLSGPAPGDAPAVVVTAEVQLVASGADVPQLTRDSVR